VTVDRHIACVVVGGIRFRAPIEEGRTVTFGSASSCDVHLPAGVDVPVLSLHLAEGVLTLAAGAEVVRDGWEAGPLALVAAGVGVEAHVVAAGPRSVFDLTGRGEFTVGPQPGACVTVADPDLALAARRAPGGGWEVSATGPDPFVNNVRRPAGRLRLRDGDHLGHGAHDLVLLDGELHVDDALVVRSGLPRLTSSRLAPPPGHPDLRRSPRIVHRPPEGTITLADAPGEPEKRTGQLLKLIVPPVVMLGVTIGTALLHGNPMMVLATGMSALVTLVLSVGGYVRDRRRQEGERAAHAAAYRAHLVERSVRIHHAADRQRQGALYHYPDSRTLTALAAQHSPRVFEKSRVHDDFLRYRLGLGTVAASTTVEDGDRERVTTPTELQALARDLADGSRVLEQMPISADLMSGPVGYVGPRRLVVEQLQLLVDQIAFFHSYHDVQLVVVSPEAERDDWSWVRWYRHSSLQDMNLRGLVHDQRSRDQVMSSLNQILTSRRNALDDLRGGRSTVFTPHYVVMVLDETLVMDHAVMELLRDDPHDLGCSVVVVEETMSSLSDSVTTVIDIRDRDTGVLVLERGELVSTPFRPDHHPVGFDRERLPRTIGALNHLQDLRSSIPESVSFLELFGVERVEQLGVAERWAGSSPRRTLGVPLGLRGAGDVVKLDLHEKAHGPHGLVAGTTGSGKSEIIQSYILSLAVNFHPHDVAFLLIDYKGGGMANLFADLPHLLGTITNLDGAQSMRALVSINAELKRRQRVFSEHDVNHINQYQKLVENGAAAEPMPHLFLVSDEFAELKAEQPEFMDELISTARIGRSLGIHLILATQKPSGVVNDQIWSNSRFKLALKVADRSDSMEIIKTPDAAEITLPGRAYLQVGNNEIYELFQSAWSGADYAPGAEDDHQEDHAIYAINDLGQYEILNPDLSGLDGAAEVGQAPTELEAVVAEVRQAALDAAVTPLPRPWLPPLPERIVVTDLRDVDPERAWAEPKHPLRPVVGRVDLPSRQTQGTLTLDVSKDGHLVVYGSPGYGKSTFLQTLVMDLARSHSPEHLHAYLLDFGTNGLLPLRGLPHVADTVTADDAQKCQKLVVRIESEIRRRKQLLSGYAVASLEMYERASGDVLPHVLLAVDGFDGLKGTPDEDAVTGLLSTVARDGAGLGIHLALSAGRSTSLRGSLSANIKTQIALRLNDDSEARGIVGRTTFEIDDVPGRGLVRLEQPEVFQVAMPARGDDTLGVIEALRAEIGRMDTRATGGRPEPIPVIPDSLDLADLVGRPESEQLVVSGSIPVGLDFESVRPVGLDLRRHRQALVVADDGETLGRVLVTLWQGAAKVFPAGVFVLDDRDGRLDALARTSGRAGATGALDAALDELTARQDDLRRAMAVPGAPTSSEHARGLDPVPVVIGDVSAVASQLGRERVTDLVRLVTDGPALGMPVLFGGIAGTAGRGFDELSKIVKAVTTGLVVARLGDLAVLKSAKVSTREPPLGDHEAYLVADGRAARIKVPARR
jgi:S-DNA-T family DNA segregation ATPase FtsK/SpoIIIE